MPKFIMCIYNIYIKLKNKIDSIINETDRYEKDYKDEEELDSLLSLDINHPYSDSEKVLYFN